MKLDLNEMRRIAGLPKRHTDHRTTALDPVPGVKQVIPSSDHAWFDELFKSGTTIEQLPQGSYLAYQIRMAHDTYRPGGVEGEIWRAPDGSFIYREILSGDADEEWMIVPPALMKLLLPYGK